MSKTNLVLIAITPYTTDSRADISDWKADKVLEKWGLSRTEAYRARSSLHKWYPVQIERNQIHVLKAELDTLCSHILYRIEIINPPLAQNNQ
jgi:hypothetical protein